jgi:hypothetical protein
VLIVDVTNILCLTKRGFAFSKIGFCDGTKVFEEALNAVKFLGWLKKFGLAQNILGSVKGQGITLSLPAKRSDTFVPPYNTNRHKASTTASTAEK